MKKRKSNGYWNEENIISELEPIIEELNHFPTINELNYIDRSDLEGAIRRNGGFLYFRKKMGYEQIRKTNGYWNEDNTVIELKPIIEELNHFPSHNEFLNMKRRDLTHAISNNGGYLYFRKKMGYELIQKPDGYWNEENTIIELNLIIEKLGRFPTNNDLLNMDRSELAKAITKNGGFPHFWEIFDVEITEKQKLISKTASYVGKRGKACEIIVKELLLAWTEAHNFPQPKLNVKLAKSKIIEFVCETNKKIGIDVTNTKDKSGRPIRNKWKHKEYQNHLDELWIVVFTDIFNDNFTKFNQKSPDNVKVMSIWTFIKELELEPDENYKDKMGNYCKCTFHNKDELMEICKK
ncbi:hypothetical protein KAU33_04275 [Candidatus Dependentiae bacterium]|nr:hypothetical protein [Candidatus Dependentiae bacterium]